MFLITRILTFVKNIFHTIKKLKQNHINIGIGSIKKRFAKKFNFKKG